MTTIVLPKRRQERGGTAAALAAENEILLAREWCIETDTGKFKIGDGVTAWNALPYVGSADIAALIHAASGKSTPVDADEIGIADSAASWVLKKLSWANVKATLWAALGVLIAAGTGKTTPVDADTLALSDSAASNATKKLALSDFFTNYLKSKTDALYTGPGNFAFTTLPFEVMPFLGRGSWGFQSPVHRNTTADNLGYHQVGGSAGTLGAVTETVGGNAFLRQTCRKYATSGAGAGSSAGAWTTATTFCGDNGLCWFWRGGMNDPAPVANARCMIGLRAGTGTPANVNPSTLTNVILIAADTGDTNLKLMHNDGSGSCTVTDLDVSTPGNFPANTAATDFYEIFFLWIPGSADCLVWVKNLTNGTIVTRTVTGSNMPASSTGLGPVHWRNNGTTALQVQFYFGTLAMAFNLAM